MSTLAARGEYRLIPLHLIDDPARVVRQQFDQEKLYELADDIRANGLLQPIGVKAIGDRYEVIYGHRRRIALSMIGALEVPCIIRENDGVSPEALKIKENKYREDINPADEALYLCELLEAECGSDTDTLANLVGESREYVEGRLLLLRADQAVFAAIRAQSISFTVARELNAIKDPSQRALYLDAAIRGGCTAKLARQWRMQSNEFAERQQAAGLPAPDASAAPTQPVGSVFNCCVCDSDDDPHLMQLVYVHDGCFRAVLRPLLRQGAR